MTIIPSQQLIASGIMAFLKILGNFWSKSKRQSPIYFRFICYQNLQYEKTPCPDFEIRFCCDKNPEKFVANNSNVPLRYSEIDFDDEEFISFEFNVMQHQSWSIAYSIGPIDFLLQQQFLLCTSNWSTLFLIKLKKVPKQVMRLLLVLSVNPVMLMIATMGPMTVRHPNAKVL